VQVKVIIRRGGLGEDALRERTDGGRIVGRDNDAKAVESTLIAFHETGGDHSRQGRCDLVGIGCRVENIHEESPADIDPRKSGVLFPGESRVGAVDRLQDLVRTPASEGGADEGP